MKYTAKEIEEIIAVAKAAKLDGLELLEGDPEAIALKFNGIGPESWPEEFRDALTWGLKYFVAAALIHDLRFTYADGSRVQFQAANVEFHNNCLKLARYYVPWWRFIRRFMVEGAAYGCYEAVSSGCGWQAYVKATSRRF